MAFLFFDSLNVLVAQLGHDLAGLLIIKLVVFVLAGLCSLLLFPLLGLLHDDLVTHRLLHDDVVEDVTKQCVLHFEFSYSGSSVPPNTYTVVQEYNSEQRIGEIRSA